MELLIIVIELCYVFDIFFFLILGVFVMWMVVGFVMLEVGLVCFKNIIEILMKNFVLYVIVCIIYLIVGYNIMYVDNMEGGWLFLFGVLIGL